MSNASTSVDPAGLRSPPLFRVLVTHRTRAEFTERWEREHGPIADPHEETNSRDPLGTDLSSAVTAPFTYPYADLYGFIEVYRDGCRLVADAFYLGDARYVAGRQLKRMHVRPLQPRAFYLHTHLQALASFTEFHTSLETVVATAVERIQVLAAAANGVAHTDALERLLPYVDWRQLLSLKATSAASARLQLLAAVTE
jgi:hypothetical protein